MPTILENSVMENRGNLYELMPEQELGPESERLKRFEIPNIFSLNLMGDIPEGALIADIGAGENPGIRTAVQNSKANYLAIDIPQRSKALLEHGSNNSLIYISDARELGFNGHIADIVHSRFLLGHINNPNDRELIIKNLVGLTKPDGKTILIDYDWSGLRGSEAVNNLREFMRNNIWIFDGFYGANSASEIADLIGSDYQVKEIRKTSPLLGAEDKIQYAPAVTLRNGMIGFIVGQTADLDSIQALRDAVSDGAPRETIDKAFQAMAQSADKSLIVQTNQIFDALELEASSDNPPGFYMPDMVATVIESTK